MSEPMNPVTGPVNAEAANVEAQTAENAANAGTVSASKTVPNNMAALKREAPEIFRAIVEGIAMVVIGQMRRSQERIKKTMREAREGKG